MRANTFSKVISLLAASQTLCFEWENPNIEDLSPIAERFNALNDAAKVLAAEFDSPEFLSQPASDIVVSMENIKLLADIWLKFVVVRDEHRGIKSRLAKMDKEMDEANRMVIRFINTVMKDAGETK
jgi:hypothetical protein